MGGKKQANIDAGSSKRSGKKSLTKMAKRSSGSRRLQKQWVKTQLSTANNGSRNSGALQSGSGQPSQSTASSIQFQEIKPTLIRVAFFLVAVILGWLLVELPWNDNPLAMGTTYIIPNLVIVGLIGSIIFCLGQRTRVSMALLVGLCLLVGIANFYVITFKGQPIVPADLFALSTAASVSSGYALFLTWRLVVCIGVFLLYCFALKHWCPKRSIAKSDVIINFVAALLLVFLCASLYQKTDIKQEYDVKVDVWDVRGSYASQGTLLCFLSRAQELVPREPADYSDEVVAAILEPYRVSEIGSNSTDRFENEQTSSNENAPAAEVISETEHAVEHVSGSAENSDSGDDYAVEETAYDGPNVVVVMNETFSDLSTYPGLEGSVAEPEFLKEVQADSLVAGDVYTSAMGGGTCNSEFEFLTGTTMGLLGAGVYPYVLYDMDRVENLASYFRDLGYDTAAIHPAEATNWRRDVVYAQLGFHSFDDITVMKDADTFRDLVTDKATYEYVLEKIESGRSPQFIFDVTIQNHGGYTTGLVPPEDAVHLDSEAVEEAELSEEVDEFLAAIHRSDEDLRWFIDQLNACEEPTVLVFFGDHQPSFVDGLFEATFDKTVEKATAEEVQERYHTPFFIWANEAAREMYELPETDGTATQMTTSLNYLGALLLDVALLPQTTYSTYLNELRNDLPVVNLNGYQDSEGQWHWFGETPLTKSQTLADDALHEYRIVQYDQLFNHDEE